MRDQSPQLQHARAVLAAVADARPGLDGLPAIRAMCELDLVCPPYPPAEPLAGATSSYADAMRALADAAEVATDPAEAARIALAAQALRLHQPR